MFVCVSVQNDINSKTKLLGIERYFNETELNFYILNLNNKTKNNKSLNNSLCKVFRQKRTKKKNVQNDATTGRIAKQNTKIIAAAQNNSKVAMAKIEQERKLLPVPKIPILFTDQNEFMQTLSRSLSSKPFTSAHSFIQSFNYSLSTRCIQFFIHSSIFMSIQWFWFQASFNGDPAKFLNGCSPFIVPGKN